MARRSTSRTNSSRLLSIRNGHLPASSDTAKSGDERVEKVNNRNVISSLGVISPGPALRVPVDKASQRHFASPMASEGAFEHGQ